jgi:hypothetical protein
MDPPYECNVQGCGKIVKYVLSLLYFAVFIHVITDYGNISNLISPRRIDTHLRLIHDLRGEAYKKARAESPKVAPRVQVTPFRDR